MVAAGWNCLQEGGENLTPGTGSPFALHSSSQASGKPSVLVAVFLAATIKGCVRPSMKKRSQFGAVKIMINGLAWDGTQRAMVGWRCGKGKLGGERHGSSSEDGVGERSQHAESCPAPELARLCEKGTVRRVDILIRVLGKDRSPKRLQMGRPSRSSYISRTLFSLWELGKSKISLFSVAREPTLC